jgi:hypothetical protein
MSTTSLASDGGSVNPSGSERSPVAAPDGGHVNPVADGRPAPDRVVVYSDPYTPAPVPGSEPDGDDPREWSFPFAVYTLSAHLKTLPPEMAGAKKWLCWANWWKNGRWVKEPRSSAPQRQAKAIDPLDPGSHSTFREVNSVLANEGRHDQRGHPRMPRGKPRYRVDGVGFVLGGGISGVALDGCLTCDGKGNYALDPWGREVLDRFPGTYAEVNPSRTGVTILLKGELAGGLKGAKWVGFGDGGEGAIEIYSRERFFPVTGLALPGRDRLLCDHGAELNRLYAGLDADHPVPGPDDDEPARGPGRRAGVITRRDAWVVGRLLAGHDPDGAVETLGGPVREVAEILAGAALEDRARVWKAFLAGRPDRDEVVCAVEAAEILGPAPEAGGDEEGDDGWGPCGLVALPPAEPFPLDVLPEPARDLAKAVAVSVACPVDFPAVVTLAAASGAVGRSTVLLVKPGYFASASLYVALVARSSAGKSPVLSAVMAPLWDIAGRLHAEWKPEMEVWEKADPGSLGEKPVLHRVATTDPTTEALGPILAKNPRGLIILPDEMTRWVMSMDQYKGGKGGDRPFYLSVWSGEPVAVDRAKFQDEPILIPHPFLAVAGGLVPGMLSALTEAEQREDGFLGRVLFSYPGRVPRRYSEEGVPRAVAGAWQALVEALWALPMPGRDDKPTPRVVRLDPDAKRAWAAWCQAHYDEQAADDFPESLEAPWGKLEGYLPRLALILHLMHLAAVPVRSSADDLPALPRGVIDDAARLVGYFKSHARRVYAEMGGMADGGEAVRALVKWVRRGRRERFSERDVTHGVPRFRDDPTTLEAALKWMVDRHMIRPCPGPDPGSAPDRVGSRPPSTRPTPTS